MAVGRRPALARARGEHGIERLIQLVYGGVYGDPDVHTHIRWRALRRHITGAIETVDIACGDGTITLEVAQAFPHMRVRGVDMNARAIASAEQRADEIHATNVGFEVGDVTDLSLGAMDQALLLDVLEHVVEDVGLLTSVSRAIKPGGRIVVSVPTSNYPRFFGREFHEAVGHVRDGYSMCEITRLLEDAGFTIVTSEHYTRLPASVACAPFYRYLWKKGRVGMALSPLLNAVSFIDRVWPSNAGASSVLLVGVKQ